MSILTRIENNDGLEFHIDESSQRVYAHMSAIQRMLEMEDNRTLRRRLEGVSKEDVRTAEIQTTNGLKLVALYPAKVVFNLALEFNTSLALAMGSAGANVFMLGISGYKIQVVEQPVELSRRDLALMVIAECDRAAVSTQPAQLTRLEILQRALEAEEKAIALAAQIEADREVALV